MKQELEDKLFNKYKKLFPYGRDDVNENLMCFGFECGDGWYNILDVLFENIVGVLGDKYNATVVRVKSRFAVLMVNTGGLHNDIYETIHNLIIGAKLQSSRTCEMCGKPAEQKQPNGWVYTLCDEHYDKVMYMKYGNDLG
jgi:hypothetical protein